ncbi:MAG: hypothetical protein KF819_33030 [Labilithrix sp.]|nr:hypothetical protein [Labilithrix sp.]
MGVLVRTSGLMVLGVALTCACAKGADVEGIDEEVDADGGAPDGSVVPRGDGGPAEGGDASFGDAGDACADALTKITFDFESGAQGFTHGNSDDMTTPAWDYDEWSLGTSTVGSACKSGNCFGAKLAENYVQCHRGYLSSPPIDLSACKGRKIAIVFHHAYAYWTGTYASQTWADGGVFEVSADGNAWQVPSGTYPGQVKINPDRGPLYACANATGFGVNGKPGFIGKQVATLRTEIQLPASVVTDKMRFRFSTAAGVSTATTNAAASRVNTDFGWRIDDISFVPK